MSDDSSQSLQTSEKPVLILVGICGLVLIGTMLFQRFTRPFLDIRELQVPQANSQGAMSDITKLMKQIETNPEDVHALRSLGTAFMRMEAWDKALLFWDRVLAITPNSSMALNQKGVCQFQKQAYPGAAATFSQLLEVDPSNAYALFNLGVLNLHFLGNVQEGEAYLQRILAMENVSQEILRAVEQELASPSEQDDQGSEKTP